MKNYDKYFFCWKISSVHLERDVDNPVKRLLTKAEVFWLNVRKWFGQNFLFVKKTKQKCTYGRVEFSFHNPTEFFCQKARNFAFIVRQDKKDNFFKKYFAESVLLLTVSATPLWTSRKKLKKYISQCPEVIKRLSF